MDRRLRYCWRSGGLSSDLAALGRLEKDSLEIEEGSKLEAVEEAEEDNHRNCCMGCSSTSFSKVNIST